MNRRENGSPPAAGSELDVRNPWAPDSSDMTLANLDEWYKGASVSMMPSKPALAREGLDALLAGWLPQQPIIGESTRVIGVGSCFASYFLLWLADNGFNRALEDSPHNALIRYGSSFENAAVIAQQFRWAFEGLDAAGLKWIDKDKEVFEASEERRRLVRRTLESTDVLVLTLGLSEVWYDERAGEPLWRALTRRHYDPQHHVFRIETVADTLRSLETIESIRRRHLPGMKIVFTVSPVRLRATFRPVSAISANAASKAILRAALDEFLRARPQLLNRELFYFPSYEIVQDYFRDPFEEDNRHVTPHVASRIVRCFAEHFCDAAVLRKSSGGAPADAGPAASESQARIGELEDRVEKLQRACDERLELIERLDLECARLRAAQEPPR